MNTATSAARPVRPSSMCDRGDHGMCKTSQARCNCRCHGKHGQLPPTVPVVGSAAQRRATPAPLPMRGTPRDQPLDLDRLGRKEPTMTVTDQPVTSNGTEPDEHLCPPPCGRTFGSAHALAIHRARGHQTPKAKPAKADPPPITKPAPRADRTIVVVDRGDTVTAIVVSTRHDADQVVQLLATLGHTALIAS